MNLQEIVRIQQDLLKAYLTNKIGVKPHGRCDLIFTGIQTASGLGAKCIDVESSFVKDEEVVKLSADYYSTWLKVGYTTNCISVHTAISRLKFMGSAVSEKKWTKFSENSGLIGRVYSPYSDKAMTRIDIYSTQGSLSDYLKASGRWGEIARVHEQMVDRENKQLFDNVQQKYQGAYTNIKDQVSVLMPMIEKIYNTSELWNALYNHRTYSCGFYNNIFDFSKENHISSESVSFEDSDGVQRSIRFEEIGFSSLKSGDELIAFTVAFYCNRNGILPSKFDFDSFTWEPIFTESKNRKGEICFSVTTPIKKPVEIKQDLNQMV